MKLVKAAFMSIACISVVAGAAGNGRSVDARTLDVAGVKTGMDINQARKAAAAHFKVPIESIRIGNPPDPMFKNPITPTVLPRSLHYEKRYTGESLFVEFQPRVPYDKNRPMAVSRIKYSVSYTPQNQEKMEKAALAKYGAPSVMLSPTVMRWCKEPDDESNHPRCSGQAMLHLNNHELTLSDPAWEDAVHDFVESLRARPNF